MKAEEILRHHDLKNTGCRKHIINELLNSEQALSESEIKTAVSDLFDRVTFYRSLKTLEENKIIHRIMLSDGSVKYALNKTGKSSCDDTCCCDHAHRHIHTHFHCRKCDEVLCVDTILENSVRIPDGFLVESVQILLEGICPECKSNKKQTV